MAKVDIIHEGKTAGVWVTNDEGQTVGLVGEDGIGAYLVIYPDTKSIGRIPFAISACHGDKNVEVQIPGPDGKLTGARIVPATKLGELLG